MPITAHRSQSVKRILPRERAEIIAQMDLLKTAVAKGGRHGVLLLGDGGVACHEYGKVLGVSAEAPLARIMITQRSVSLEGVGGMASRLKRWGVIPMVSTPERSGQVSRLQRQLFARDGVTNLGLQSQFPQVIRYTQRVFAESHQFTHIEREEEIPPANPAMVKRSFKTLADLLERTDLLCVVDNETG